MSLYGLERDHLPTFTQTAEKQALQPPKEILFNRPRLLEFAGNMETSAELQIAGWDSYKEIIRFLNDINLGLIKGWSLQQAVAFSAKVFADHIRFYDAEFIKQEPAVPHVNHFGFWQGQKRWLGNNGRPVVDSVDEQERMGAPKRSAIKTEEFLLAAENNSLVVSISAQGPSGYLDKYGCDAPHLNTYIFVDYKDQNGNLQGATLMTDLTVDQAEKLMVDLGAPANFLAKRGSQLERVANLLENPAVLSLPERYRNPLEFMVDQMVAVRGNSDIHLRQKSGPDEIRSIAEIRRKIANFETLLETSIAKDRLLENFQNFVLASYQQVEDPAFQQEIINLSEKIILLFAHDFQQSRSNNLPASSLVTRPLFSDQYIHCDWETIRSWDRRDVRELFSQDIAFLQTRAGCPSRVRGAAKGLSGVSVLGESDSMGSLFFTCPVCGAINKRPYEGYVNNCQSCGTDKVACKSSGAKKEEKQGDAKIISFSRPNLQELSKAA